MSDLIRLLQMEAVEIAHSFEKARIEGRGTAQEVSDRREAALKRFIERYFPFPYRVAKGNVIDSFGSRSASIDCILLNPSHPHTVDADNRFSIIVADAVDFAIEVKPNLSSRAELRRGLDQLRSVKRLQRKQVSGVAGLTPQAVIEVMGRIPCALFADEVYSDTRTLIAEIVSYYEEEMTPAVEQFDFIVVNNWGIVWNSRRIAYGQIGGIEGLVYAELGDAALGYFLLAMNQTPGSTMPLSEPVLKRYLLPFFSNMNCKTFHDLNHRLRAIDAGSPHK